MANGKEYDNWKVGQSQFQGYMKAKMESHDKLFIELKKDSSEQQKKIDSLETSRDRVKGALMVLTFIWGFVLYLFSKFGGR